MSLPAGGNMLEIKNIIVRFKRLLNTHFKRMGDLLDEQEETERPRLSEIVLDHLLKARHGTLYNSRRGLR